MAKENLTTKEKNIVLISSYTASGDLDKLEQVTKKGLEEGLTINEVKEVMVQLYAYCGFPKSINAVATLMKVSKNGKYKEGKAGAPLKKDADKNAIGEKTQTELCGSPVKGELFEFAPALDDYLKEHLFGDIFARGVLTHKEREIATVSALAAIGNVQPQLNAHIQIAKNTGVTQEQTDEILDMVKNAQYKPSFGLGEKNDAYAKYFIGQSYLNPLSKEQVPLFNVTFEPKCRNNWHIHHAGRDGKGGQILIVTDGRGYYQEWGKPAIALKPGMIIAVGRHNKSWAGSIWGHVGVYVGNGMVMDNIGYIRTISVLDWIDYYGEVVKVKWGWFGKSLA
jgi:alkylhydroperoxidase/carboxymuconolactone decarboxylase family protein YurZ